MQPARVRHVALQILILFICERYILLSAAPTFALFAHLGMHKSIKPDGSFYILLTAYYYAELMCTNWPITFSGVISFSKNISFDSLAAKTKLQYKFLYS